jgi:hypothetical protein
MNSSRTLFVEIKISKLMNYWTMVIGYGQMLIGQLISTWVQLVPTLGLKCLWMFKPWCISSILKLVGEYTPIRVYICSMCFTWCYWSCFLLRQKNCHNKTIVFHDLSHTHNGCCKGVWANNIHVKQKALGRVTKLMTFDDWVELKVYSHLVLRTLVLSPLTPS